MAFDVHGLQGTITDVRVNLIGLSHTLVGDLDMLLIAPEGGSRNLLFWGDVQRGGARLSLARRSETGAPG